MSALGKDPQWVTFDSSYRLGLNPFRSCVSVVREIREHAWQIWIVFKSSFTATFRETALGKTWGYVMPLVPIGAFLCLSVLRVFPADASVHPLAYLGVGLVLWLLFQGLVLAPMEAADRFRSVVKSTEFPLICIFIASYGRPLFDTCVRLVIVIPLVLSVAQVQPKGLALLPALLVPALAFCFSLGIALAMASSVVRDVRHVADITFRYLIFVSCAIFPLPLDSELAFWLYSINPLAVFIDNARSVLLLGTLATPGHLMVYSTLSLGSVVLTAYVYHGLERRLVGAMT